MKYMKQITALFLVIAMVFALFHMPEYKVQAAGKTDWKKVYRKLIKQKYDPSKEVNFGNAYRLIDVNDDSIPELVVIAVDAVYIYTVSGQNYDVLTADIFTNFYYVKKKNSLLVQYNNFENKGWDRLYKIKKGKFTCYWKGKYNQKRFNTKKKIYDCKINGKTINTNIYKKKIATLKKERKSVCSVTKTMNSSQILHRLRPVSQSRRSLKAKYIAYVQKNIIGDNRNYQVKCYMYDFNNDGQKEVIVDDGSGGRTHSRVYTYKNGSVKELLRCEYIGYKSGRNCLIAKMFSFSNNEKKEKLEETFYYDLSDGALRLVCSYYQESMQYKKAVDNQEIVISEKEYNEYVSNITTDFGKGFVVSASD